MLVAAQAWSGGNNAIYRRERAGKHLIDGFLKRWIRMRSHSLVQSRASIHLPNCCGYVSPSMNSISISNYVIGAISEIAVVRGQRM